MKIARKVLPILLSLVLIAGFFSYVSVGKVSADTAPVIADLVTTETSSMVYKFEYDVYYNGDFTQGDVQVYYDPAWTGSPERYSDGTITNGINDVGGPGLDIYNSTFTKQYVGMVNGVKKYHVTYDHVDFNNIPNDRQNYVGRIAFEMKVHDASDLSIKSNCLYTDYINQEYPCQITVEANKTYNKTDFFGEYSYIDPVYWRLFICNKNIVDYNSSTDDFTTKNTGCTLIMAINNKNGHFENIVVNVVQNTSPISCSITSTNNVANQQTATLKINSTNSIAGYYWGTNSNYTSNTYTSTTSSSIAKEVNTEGTYYLVAKDTSGNVSSPVSITYYRTTLNANGGSVSPSYVLTKAYNTFTMPTPSKTGSTFNGWSTSSTATSGNVTSVTANSNITYYATWKDGGSSALSLNKLTYSFSNSYSGFGYSSTYKIPLSSYQLIYGNTTMAKKYYNKFNSVWGGNCFGMASTSGMFNVPGSGVTLSNFNTSASKVSDLGVKNSGNLGFNLTTFIEAMQVSQYSKKIETALDNTENKLSNLSSAVESVATTGKPVLIAVYGKEGGHALLGYKVEKINDTTSYLHVYDCNYPSTDRYIKLTTNSSGSVTGWYYYLNNMYNWGSSYSGSRISYVTYDNYQYAWKNRGSITSDNVLITNSDSFNIYDYDSKLVARVQNGTLSSSVDDIILIEDIGMTADGYSAQTDDTKIMMPTDLYTIENKDSSISKFEATMVNTDRAATVGTNSDRITFAVDDSEELNDVLIDAKKGQKYEVSLESSDAKDVGLVEVGGIGEGKKVSVSQDRGNVSINNCAGATISINGEAISNTGTDDAKDLKKASARLEYTEVAYDGKAKYPKISIVDANNNLLELGKDYIPFYSNNVNKGVASVTVYGIGAYSGSKTLSFIISDKKADTQPPSLGKVNLKAKNIKKKAVKLSWKKIKNANGYTVQYALNKKFTKKKKTVNVKASKTSKTIKKLKKKKTYYFRARAYCNYKGKKVYGKWSKVKKVKIKK